MNKEEILKKVLLDIKSNVTQATYDSFISKVKIHNILENPNLVELSTDKEFTSNILNRRYNHVFEDSLKSVLGKNYRVVIKPEFEYKENNKVIDDTKKSTAYNLNFYSSKEKIFNPKFTFDNFVVGNSNTYAYSACMAVAKNPSSAYNPLFIYGKSGLGKTHLLNAIGIYLLENNENMRILYVSSETFTNDFIKALQEGKAFEFKSKYRKADVLLVDDIQFLESKEHTQEEFFHTFNKLYKDHKQMVFTSDRPPQNIKKLEDRLRSRFQGGTVVNIDPPDLETRTAILRNRAKIEHLPIDKEAIDYIASNVSENIRELEGAFIRAQMQASVENSPITLEVTQRALQELVKTKQERKYITIDEITKHVCSYYKIKYEDLMSKTKLKKIAFPRQIAMYLCRELTEHTYPHIGAAFNDRDHTTVMYAVNKISKEVKKDDSLRKAVEQIKNSIIHVDK